MQSTIIKIAGIVLLSLIADSCFSQWAVSGYCIYGVGVKYDSEQRFGGELKLYANRPAEELLTEVDVFYNFDTKKYHRFSVGLGVVTAPFRGYDHVDAFAMPAVLEVYPLREFKQISMLLELAPEYYIEDQLHVRYLWGVRYTFNQ